MGMRSETYRDDSGHAIFWFDDETDECVEIKVYARRSDGRFWTFRDRPLPSTPEARAEFAADQLRRLAD